MAAAVDREREVLLACEVHGRDDVLRGASSAAITAGLRSIMPLKTWRASSYLASSGWISCPPNPDSSNRVAAHWFPPQLAVVTRQCRLPQAARAGTDAQRTTRVTYEHMFDTVRLPGGEGQAWSAGVRRAALPFELLVPRRGEPSRGAGRGSGAARARRARDHRPRRLLRRGPLRRGGARGRPPHRLRRGADARRAAQAPERDRRSAG